jgi:hypothetical protein
MGRSASSGSRTRRPKSSQRVVTALAPEAIERFANAIRDLACAIDRPRDAAAFSDPEKAERAKRERLGAEYIAAIAEQRPGTEGHGYPGGEPDWDQPYRLNWSGIVGGNPGIEFIRDLSMILPAWMALPLVRRMRFGENSQDRPEESGETPEG